MRILLAVSGSISAYKAYDLCRELYKKGHEVKVILTQGALEFIKAETFYYIGALDVYLPQDDFNLTQYPQDKKVLHIELAKWCDRLVICPLSANTLANLSAGNANSLLGSVFLALPATKPILLFPAMNPNMFTHPFTKRNLQTLQTLSNVFIHPTQEGEMVCGDEGVGKLASIGQAVDFIESYQMTSSTKKVLITTGATQSPLDPVRFLTNPSSGLTGYEFAKYYLSQGHKVIVVAGLNSTSQLEQLSTNPHFTLIRVQTSSEMLTKVLEEISTSQLFIASAAVCDIVFEKQEQKMKKDQMPAAFSYQVADDILKCVIDLKQKDLKIVGFAAETQLDEQTLLTKWKKKPCDLLVGNKVSNGKDLQGFQSEMSEFIFFEHGEITGKAILSKKELARFIAQKVNFL